MSSAITRSFPLASHSSLRAALKQIYGVGTSRSQTLSSVLGYNPKAIVKDLLPFQKNKISDILGPLAEEGKMIQTRQKDNIEKLIRINHIRGIRHKLGFPTRGQKTSRNAKTATRGRRALIAAKLRDIMRKKNQLNKKK